MWGERQAVLYTMRDSKVARLDVFPDRDAALKAVGLGEQFMLQENVDVWRASIEDIGAEVDRGEFDQEITISKLTAAHSLK